MAAEDTAVHRSPLDKPLHLLTEDDISQVTREDCRRYLKSKGMRRPSWNKSQVIQQVISLKTLFEATPNSAPADDAALKKLYIPRPENPHRVRRFPRPVPVDSPASGKATALASSSAEDSVSAASPRRNDLDTTVCPADSSARVAAVDNDAVSPRNMGATSTPAGQMTIFYHGKVFVYDGVPCNQACRIMQIAASPGQFLPEAPSDGAAASSDIIPCQLQAAGFRIKSSPMVIVPSLKTVRMTEKGSLSREENNGSCREDNQEVPISRKASVLKYLEKRKDRFKCKKRPGIPSSRCLDVLGRSTSFSSLQPQPPLTPARCNSVENVANEGCLRGDVIEKGV